MTPVWDAGAPVPMVPGPGSTVKVPAAGGIAKNLKEKPVRSEFDPEMR